MKKIDFIRVGAFLLGLGYLQSIHGVPIDSLDSPESYVDEDSKIEEELKSRNVKHGAHEPKRSPNDESKLANGEWEYKPKLHQYHSFAHHDIHVQSINVPQPKHNADDEKKHRELLLQIHGKEDEQIIASQTTQQNITMHYNYNHKSPAHTLPKMSASKATPHSQSTTSPLLTSTKETLLAPPIEPVAGQEHETPTTLASTNSPRPQSSPAPTGAPELSVPIQGTHSSSESSSPPSLEHTQSFTEVPKQDSHAAVGRSFNATDLESQAEPEAHAEAKETHGLPTTIAPAAIHTNHHESSGTTLQQSIPSTERTSDFYIVSSTKSPELPPVASIDTNTSPRDEVSTSTGSGSHFLQTTTKVKIYKSSEEVVDERVNHPGQAPSKPTEDAVISFNETSKHGEKDKFKSSEEKFTSSASTNRTPLPSVSDKHNEDAEDALNSVNKTNKTGESKNYKLSEEKYGSSSDSTTHIPLPVFSNKQNEDAVISVNKANKSGESETFTPSEEKLTSSSASPTHITPLVSSHIHNEQKDEAVNSINKTNIIPKSNFYEIVLPFEGDFNKQASEIEVVKETKNTIKVKIEVPECPSLSDIVAASEKTYEQLKKDGFHTASLSTILNAAKAAWKSAINCGKKIMSRIVASLLLSHKKH